MFLSNDIMGVSAFQPTGLSPSVEPVPVSPPDGASIPDATVMDFLAFAKSKPADEGFSYSDTRGCAYAQFLKATGRAKAPNVGGRDWDDRFSVGNPIPDILTDFYPPVFRSILQLRNWGKVVDALEQRLAEA